MYINTYIHMVLFAFIVASEVLMITSHGAYDHQLWSFTIAVCFQGDYGVATTKN